MLSGVISEQWTAMTGQTSSDWLGLSGRVGVVTGAGGGIGRAVAASLARAGAHVAAIDRDERGLEGTDAALRELACEYVIATCDTSNALSVAAASETIEKSLGPCSVLVNAAAVLRPGALEGLSLAEWNAVLSHGIRSNVVSPGMIITPMSQSFYDTPGVTERRTAVVPTRRIGMPQDIADAILFLASDRSSYVNGDEITVDGGYANMLMNLVPRPGFDQKPD